MEKFLSYNSFVNESVQIPIMKDANDFINGILLTAKKSKIIKQFGSVLLFHRDIPLWAHGHPGERWTYDKKYLCFEHLLELDGKPLAAGILVPNPGWSNRYEKENIDPANILIVSNYPINLINLENVFPTTIETSLGKDLFSFNRKLLVDHSATLGDLYPYTTDKIRGYDNVKISSSSEKMYYVVFEYIKTSKASETVDINVLKSTDEYKDLINSLPVELISTPIQIKKMTIVFGIKASHLFDPTNPARFESEKYYPMGKALYERGYIRNYSVNGERHSVAGSFNAATLQGWQQGLKQIKEKFEKQIKDIRKDGIFVDLKSPIDYTKISPEIQKQLVDEVIAKRLSWSQILKYISPDIQQKYRGGIHGSSFGI